MRIEDKWLEVLVKLYERELKLDKGIFKGNKKEQLLNNLEVLEHARQEVMLAYKKNERVEELEKLYKDFYYGLYLIKEEDIPFSVYENEVRLARERGYGNLDITDEYKKEMNQSIINNQKESLDKWLDYFLYDDEAKSYKAWEVFWVLEGIQKLGKYDKEKHKYTKRDKTTTYPYPSVNKVAIFNTLNLMEQYLKNKTGEKDIKGALGQANFKQLYEYSINQMMQEREQINTGIEGTWIKYEQGSDYHKLRDSLQGYNTGWCTEAGEEFAKQQLAGGDFYVYYSVDNNGEYKIPRIAIKMDGHNKIGEIRGIEKDQNLESEMLPILDEKLNEFPYKDEFLKKEHDMKLLTEIENKVNKDIELTKEELRFLYEVDSKIDGFGWEKDPRVGEIKDKRDVRNDYSKIFECEPNQIALTQMKWEKNPSQYKILVGDLDLSGLTSAEGLILQENIGGALDLSGLTSAEGLVFPKGIGGSLYLDSLTSAEGLVLPKSIGESLYLERLASAKGLVLPENIGGTLNLSGLTSAEGLVLPKSIGWSLCLDSLTSAEGLVFPKGIGGILFLDSLTSAEGLVLPKSIGVSLYLERLASAKGLVLPENIGDTLDLSGLTSAEGLVLPKSIGGSLCLDSLTSAEGLVLPKSIGESLYLKRLASAKGLVLPKNIGSMLDLSGLTSAEGLVLPKSIGGNLCLNSLISAEGLVLPKSIGVSLYLKGLASTKGLVLPENIGGALDLSGLTSAEGLVLPKSIGGSLYLDRLTSVDGLIIPDSLTYKIKMCGFEIIPENVDQYRTNKHHL